MWWTKITPGGSCSCQYLCRTCVVLVSCVCHTVCHDLCRMTARDLPCETSETVIYHATVPHDHRTRRGGSGTDGGTGLNTHGVRTPQCMRDHLPTLPFPA